MPRTEKSTDQDRVVGKMTGRERDQLRVARSFLAWHTCRLCNRPTARGYICFHCQGDDTATTD